MQMMQTFSSRISFNLTGAERLRKFDKAEHYFALFSSNIHTQLVLMAWDVGFDPLLRLLSTKYFPKNLKELKIINNNETINFNTNRQMIIDLFLQP